jgi:hypothetical protein
MPSEDNLRIDWEKFREVEKNEE